MSHFIKMRENWNLVNTFNFITMLRRCLLTMLVSVLLLCKVVFHSGSLGNIIIYFGADDDD